MGKQQVKYFVVDAFTDSPFKGNPAAVCLLEEDKDEKWLQAVAAEFNISETCYLTSITGSDTANLNPRFSLRWFTPVAEVKLCGHATLAAAHTLFSNGLVHSNIIEFDTLSGILNAKKVPQISKTDVSSNQNSKAVDCFLIELNFPSDSTAESNSVDFASITKALNGASTIDIRRTTTSDDLLVVLPSAKAVTEIQPQFDEIVKFPGRGVIVTGVAPSESGFDFYSRFFCPKFGINEDPVCGSAHCALTTYWSKKLGKCDLMAYQASPRGGILDIHLDEANQRVLLRGKAVTVMEGFILVDSFTPSALKGNPVAACLLNEEKDKKWLPSVAAEYNVSESIYSISITFSVTVNSSPNFQLRWFTPVAEGVSSIVFAILINERIQISKTAKAKDSFLIESIFLVSRHLNSSLDVDQAQVSKVMNVASIIDVKRIIT